MNNPAFTRPMDAKAHTYEKYLEELGPSKAVDLFLSKYGNLNTRVGYAGELVFYLRWLRKAHEVRMNPDELVLDNLQAVYESKAVDVTTKRRHNDWLNEYINHYLLDQGFSEGKRHLALHAIRQFY